MRLDPPVVEVGVQIAFVRLIALVLPAAVGCGTVSGTHATGGSGRGGAPAATAGAAPTAGSQAPTAGKSGAPAATAGVGTGSAGAASPACTVSCPAKQHCEWVQVMCIRAPCPPVAMCVADAPTDKACGSRGLAACADGEYCAFPAGGSCGADDRPGTCKPRPSACTEQYTPVCGCDDMTYGNECAAAAMGVSVKQTSACMAAGVTGPNCDVSQVTCRRAPPVCAEGQVPTASGACFGPCVAIEACLCTQPSECPNSDKYTCLRSAGHCTPYL